MKSRHVVSAGLACIVAAGAGCASGTNTFKSRTDLASASTIERLLVIDDLADEAFTEQLYAGFKQGISSALETCGVKPRLIQADPMELDPKARLEAITSEFHPSATLLINAKGGNRVIGGGVTKNEMSIEFQVIDASTSKMTWLAKSLYKVGTGSAFGDDQASGQQFGTSVVVRMRDDGLLKTCPTGADAWPKADDACRQERDAKIDQAKQAGSAAERKRLLSEVPTCR